MPTTRRRRPRSNRQQSPYFKIPYISDLRNPWRPYEVATDEIIEKIHDASMRILENTGIRFDDAEALDLWEKVGAQVDKSSRMVQIDRGLLLETLATAPSTFTFRARNPERSRFIGENSINFFSAAGTVFAGDMDRGRRPGMNCLLYTSPSPRDLSTSRMPSSA